MLKPLITPQYKAALHHKFLPDNVREYLKSRGIPATVIDRELLGWDGAQITIPILGHGGEVLGFSYAWLPPDLSAAPGLDRDPHAVPALYGGEVLEERPRRVVICENEFDRLVLEGHGICAVASTGGAEVFPRTWAARFEGVRHVYICFNRGTAGDRAAKEVRKVLPQARIARLPSDLGEGGTITDFFVGLQRTKLDFEIVLANATSKDDDPDDLPPAIKPVRPADPSLRKRAEEVRRAVPLHRVVAHFTELQAEGKRLVGQCLLHNGRELSFTVYPQENTYSCSGCDAKGEVVQFLMDKESMPLKVAIETLECYLVTNEIYATSF